MPKSIKRAILTNLMGSICLVVASASYSESVTLFTDKPVSKSQPTDSFHVSGTNLEIGQSLIEVNSDIFNLSSGDLISLNIEGLSEVWIEFNSIVEHESGNLTLIGQIQGAPGYRVFITRSGSTYTGKISTPEGSYSIRSISGQTILVDYDEAGLLPFIPTTNDSVTPPPPPATNLTEPQSSLISSDVPSSSIVDLLILYSPGIAAKFSGVLLQAEIDTMVARTNQAFSDSAVIGSINVLGIEPISYADDGTNDGTNSAAHHNLTNNIGAFSGVSARRDALGADLVIFLRTFKQVHVSCGQAWTLIASNYNNPQNFKENLFYGVVSVGNDGSFFCTDNTFPHELGHLMGSDHDWTTGAGQGAFSYANGYGIPSVLGTIMSYQSPEVTYFSNPDLLTECLGQECGVAIGLAGQEADNRTALSTTIPLIASFRIATDLDGDGITGTDDNCPLIANSAQVDTDADGDGDACDTDDDGDGIPDGSDLYPLSSIGILADTDGDGAPNDCDAACISSGMGADDDDDNDGVLDINDDYPLVSLGGLTDGDGDGVPDICNSACLAQGMVPDPDIEENDTFETAATVAPGVYTQLGADDDWFRFENLNPGLFYLKMVHDYPSNLTDHTNDLNMVLYDTNPETGLARVRAANNFDDMDEELFFHVDSPGTYYVRVFPTAGGTNTYTLTAVREYTAAIDDSNGNNDAYDSAISLDSAGFNQIVSGNIASDEDWYNISIPAGTLTVALDYSSAAGELKLEVWGSSVNRLNNTTGAGGSATLKTEINATQNIRISVVGRTGATYTLTIEHPVKWITTLSAGPITDSSPTIVDVDNDGTMEIFIGTGPLYDSGNNEIRPAQLVRLEHGGTVTWTTEFPAASTADPLTGIVYRSSSIASHPIVADVDADGQLEVIVSVGADLNYKHPVTGEIYSPGHKGGVYSVSAATGIIEWSRISVDTSGPLHIKDNLPDGVYSSPVVCDINQDGFPEVAWGGWDQYIYLVNGTDGLDYGAFAGSKWPINVHDTSWSSPLCADINNNGLHELLIGADISENADALTLTGGIFHIYNRWGQDIIPGFNAPIEFTPGNNLFSFLKGKYENQTLWSSPVVGDLDNDGTLEIGYGTGLFFLEPAGNYIRIWNHDGTEYLKLDTVGRTFSIPLFADLDNDGVLEIIAVTARGYLHVWNNQGVQSFPAKEILPTGAVAGDEHAIYAAPLAVDMTGDGKLEIVLQQAGSMIVVDYQGNQLSDPSSYGMHVVNYSGTPAIGDIDNDGILEIVSGGSNSSRDTGLVYVFQYDRTNNVNSGYLHARREFRENGVIPISDSLKARRVQVEDFVKRFYLIFLGRSFDPWGLADWVNNLLDNTKSGADVAKGFVFSNEYLIKETTNPQFVIDLYSAFFNRTGAPDKVAGWVQQLDDGASRADILFGFYHAVEFHDLSWSFSVPPEQAENAGGRRVLIEEFVIRFYQQVLLRQPDGPGLAFWTDHLMFGTKTGAEVAYGFVFSNDSLARGLNHTEYVKMLYRAFFGRSADPGGLAGWVDALEKGNLTREEVLLDGFTTALEYTNLTNSYGITPR